MSFFLSFNQSNKSNQNWKHTRFFKRLRIQEKCPACKLIQPQIECGRLSGPQRFYLAEYQRWQMPSISCGIAQALAIGCQFFVGYATTLLAFLSHRDIRNDRLVIGPWLLLRWRLIRSWRYTRRRRRRCQTLTWCTMLHFVIITDVHNVNYPQSNQSPPSAKTGVEN